MILVIASMGTEKMAPGIPRAGRWKRDYYPLRDIPEGQALLGGGMRVKRLGGGHCGDRSVAAMTIFYRRLFTCAPALPT